MTLTRRVILYLVGLALGVALVASIFRDRFPSWLPQTIIMEKLVSNPLLFTKHARCTMNCRKITEKDVTLALKYGRINFRKSRVNDKPCKSYALEYTTEGSRFLRVIFAGCEDVTKVVTAIDVNKRFDCKCD